MDRDIAGKAVVYPDGNGASLTIDHGGTTEVSRGAVVKSENDIGGGSRTSKAIILTADNQRIAT